MPETYELRIWADGVVKDSEGNIIPPPTSEDDGDKPEIEESLS